MGRKAEQTILTDWKTFGLPVFACLFAPWQDKITSLPIISSWFQPTASITASLIGPLACFVAYAILFNQARYTKQRVALLSGVFCLTFIVSCLAFKIITRQIALSDNWNYVIWITWFLIYISIFITFGTSSIAALLAVKQTA
jgi:hypothetical protein